jgi:acyl dehydratase
MKFFDDMQIGDRRELGKHLFTAKGIKRFAASFDPQPFHMDEEEARRSHFGALCASGWHSTAACMRLIVV